MTDWEIIEGVVSRAQQTSEGENYDLATQALNAICRLRQKPAITDLLPCPFCGGRASGIQPYGTFERDANGDRIDKGDFIDCIECGASVVRAGGNGISVERRHAALINGWNRRPCKPDATRNIHGDVIEDIKDFVKELHRPAWEEPNWDYAAQQLANSLGVCWPDANRQMSMQAYKRGLKSAYQLGRKSIAAEAERHEA